MTEAAANKPAEWDRHSIKAEVERRGMALSRIAEAAGLQPNACSNALRGLNRKGADAIAAALNIPFDELFPPGMFARSRRSRMKPTPPHQAESRQKRTPSTEKAEALS